MKKTVYQISSTCYFSVNPANILEWVWILLGSTPTNPEWQSVYTTLTYSNCSVSKDPIQSIEINCDIAVRVRLSCSDLLLYFRHLSREENIACLTERVRTSAITQDLKVLLWKKKKTFMHLIKKKSRAENELTTRTMQGWKKDTPPATAVHSRNVEVVALADVDGR